MLDKALILYILYIKIIPAAASVGQRKGRSYVGRLAGNPVTASSA